VCGAAELEHRQRIHVGAQAHAAACASTPQRGDHACAGNAFVNVEAERAHRLRGDAGGAMLLERELGMRVQIAAQRDQIGEQVSDRRVVDEGTQRAADAKASSTASASSASVRK